MTQKKAQLASAIRHQTYANCSAGILECPRAKPNRRNGRVRQEVGRVRFLNLAVPPEDGKILVYHPESRPQAWREIETSAIMRLMLKGL